jgi:hypothetical protein
MFESGKRTTYKKPEVKTGEGCDLPTFAQIQDLWKVHFEPCLFISDNFDKSKNAAIMQDKDAYLISVLKSIQ